MKRTLCSEGGGFVTEKFLRQGLRVSICQRRETIPQVQVMKYKILLRLAILPWGLLINTQDEYYRSCFLSVTLYLGSFY